MGKHPCTAWVPILWGKCRDLAIIKRRRAPHLPYDIMVDILARLPAKFIFQLWQQTNPSDSLYHLIMNSNFLRAHLNHCKATPTIVVHSAYAQSDYKHIKLFLFDGAAENVEPTSLDVSSWKPYYEMENQVEPIVCLCGSYDGFLVFQCQTSSVPFFCFWNPVTKEQVVLTCPRDAAFSVCGFYLHPRRKEYEVVCKRRSADNKKVWDFEILNLRSKRRRSVGSCSYPPSRIRWPVFINGTFYWLVDSYSYWVGNRVHPSLSDSILSFNVVTEEFRTVQVVMPSNFPPPSPDTTSMRLPSWVYGSSQQLDGCRYRFQLFDLDGELGLFDPSSSTDVFIWVFNYGTQCWDTKHSIPSPVYEQHWDFRNYFNEIEYIKMKGEFIAYDRSNRNKPYIYNLRLGTWKLVEWEGFEGYAYETTIHTHSLVPLDAADSVISL